MNAAKAAGHTFMFANSFHHQVELSMKHEGKLYDFKQAVANSNNGKIKVKKIKVADFVFLEDCTSFRKIATTKTVLLSKWHGKSKIFITIILLLITIGLFAAASCLVISRNKQTD